MTTPHSFLEMLQNCERTSQQGSVALGEILQEARVSGFPLVLTLFAIPFLQPISLGPLGTIGGLTFCILGWQMLRGHTTVALPKRVAELRVGGRAWRSVLSFGVRLIRLTMKLSAPRCGLLLAGQHAHKVIGALTITGGALIAVPWVGVPFNNTFPALTVLFAALALIQRDGLFVLLSVFFTLVTLAYFALLSYVLLFVGQEAFQLLVQKFAF